MPISAKEIVAGHCWGTGMASPRLWVSHPSGSLDVRIPMPQVCLPECLHKSSGSGPLQQCFTQKKECLGTISGNAVLGNSCSPSTRRLSFVEIALSTRSVREDQLNCAPSVLGDWLEVQRTAENALALVVWLGGAVSRMEFAVFVPLVGSVTRTTNSASHVSREPSLLGNAVDFARCALWTHFQTKAVQPLAKNVQREPRQVWESPSARIRLGFA